MSGYDKSFIIKFYRNKVKMTQEELADGICSPVTLARYENGTLNPSDENFQKIMDKLEGYSDTILFNVQTENLFFASIRDELLFLFERRKFDEAQFKIDKIKSKGILSTNYVENKQFIERIECNIFLEKGLMELNEYIQRVEELLRLSFPEYQSEYFVSKAVYTETELLLLNNIATAYGQINNFEVADRIFDKVIVQVCENIFDEYRPMYLLFVNYANLLGLNAYYDKSIAVCNQGIQWLLKNNKANYLYNFYYNIGWNLIEKYKQTPTETRIKDIGRVYIWEAYQLCTIYPENSQNISFIRAFYESIDNL